MLSIECSLLTSIYLMLKFVDELPLDDDANGFSGWGRLDVHALRVRTLYIEPLYIRIPPNIFFAFAPCVIPPFFLA